VAVYPDAADEIAVVTNGRGGMPAFSERLSAEEIAAVVDYTRTVLADVQP
jgi:mono/diheme cytochrome c family protein